MGDAAYDNRTYPNSLSKRRIGAVLFGDPEEPCSWHTAGRNGVAEIREHHAEGEGDRWYYDIHMDSGQVFRRFDAVAVQFDPE